ncbi:hypothetical protein RO21_03500, partial [[Actinobacillus] muris]
MAGLTEQSKWENEIYRIEENDPVHGGENGITNKPTKQLANRTQYLKKMLEAAGQKLNPKKLTATTRNAADTTGHTHEIDLASTTTKGLVQLTNDTGLESESLALTAKAGKKLAQDIARVQQLASAKYTERAATTYHAGTVQLNNTLTSTDTTQALTAAQGKALKDELDALSVGGRNYLRNGRFENALTHWQNWGDCTRLVETVDNKKWVRLMTDNLESYRGISQTVATFERNTRYTLSFKAYSRRENARLQLAVHQIPNNNPQVWSSPIAITTTPQTYVWSFTSADLDNKTGFHLMLGGVSEQPFDIYLTDIKFEKGHRRSDWSAAPEDVMDSVQDYVRTHYVAKTGDTMTGELTLSATQPMLRLQRPSGSGFYLGFPSTTSNTAVWYAQNHGTGLFLLGNQVMANKDFYVSIHKAYHEGIVLPARQVNLRSN